jgi:hypothetical protein
MKETKKLAIATLWVCGYLLLIDISINLIFPYPKDPHDISPSSLAQFFEYGRSVEGKLARMTGKTDEDSAPILFSGWLQGLPPRIFSNNAGAAKKPTITFYGMSHSVLLAEELAKIDDSFFVRSFGAPGAIPSWSYSAFLHDKGSYHSDVVVLGLMTRGVSLICTTSGTTNHFDSVCPYTYPRYSFRDGMLSAVSPPFVSLEGYREYFYDSEKWNSYLKWLSQYDKYYDPILFRKTLLDGSSLVRMLRRGYAYSSQVKKETSAYEEGKGFKVDSEEVNILRSIIVNFAQEARKDKSLPVIYIVNNVFMSDYLYRILEPVLSSYRIPFLSSHTICAPDDPRNYLPDSHFIPSKNSELARAMIRIIRENLPADRRPHKPSR